MWIGRNKNGSFSISESELKKGVLYGVCPTDNNGNLIENHWVCIDGSTPDIVHINLMPNLRWEDDAVEVLIISKAALIGLYKIIDNYKNGES